MYQYEPPFSAELYLNGETDPTTVWRVRDPIQADSSSGKAAIYDYIDPWSLDPDDPAADGDIRAVFTLVAPNEHSPIWLLNAGREGRYQEVQYAECGLGHLALCKEPQGETRMITLSPATPRIPLGSGDAFQYIAGRFGLGVMALLPGEPFTDDCETEITSFPDRHQ